MERVIQELMKLFGEVGRGGLGKLDPRLTAVLLVGAMQYYFVSYPLTSKLLGAESDALKTQLKRHITALFVGGFAAHTTHPLGAPSTDQARSVDSAKKRRAGNKPRRSRSNGDA
jgi:hypothetical protein